MFAGSLETTPNTQFQPTSLLKSRQTLDEILSQEEKTKEKTKRAMKNERSTRATNKGKQRDRDVDEQERYIPTIVPLTGKLNYELAKEHQARKLPDRVTLIRLEAISPFPFNELRTVLERYVKCGEIIWAQEKPKNQ